MLVPNQTKLRDSWTELCMEVNGTSQQFQHWASLATPPLLVPAKSQGINHFRLVAFPQCKFRVYSIPSNYDMIRTTSISFKCFIGLKDGCFY